MTMLVMLLESTEVYSPNLDGDSVLIDHHGYSEPACFLFLRGEFLFVRSSSLESQKV